MNKNIIYISLIVTSFFVSCQKEKAVINDELANDSIKEVTYSTDPDYILANKNAQELVEHLESEQKDLKLKLKKASKKEAEALYLDYYKRLTTIVDSLNNAELNTLNAYHAIIEHKHDSILRKENTYDKVNLYFRKIDSTHYDFRIKPGYFYNLFHNKVPKAYEQYLKLRYDEHLLSYNYQLKNEKITLEKKRDLIIQWEKFITNYKDFKFIDYAKKSYSENLMDYLFGTAQNPTFEVSTKKLFVESEQEYISFVKKNPRLMTAEITKQYLKHFYENDKNFTNEQFYLDLKEFTKKAIADKIK